MLPPVARCLAQLISQVKPCVLEGGGGNPLLTFPQEDPRCWKERSPRFHPGFYTGTMVWGAGQLGCAPAVVEMVSFTHPHI